MKKSEIEEIYLMLGLIATIVSWDKSPLLCMTLGGYTLASFVLFVHYKIKEVKERDEK